jgi:uncharacterized glyoxalase superfamily protein PhnB
MTEPIDPFDALHTGLDHVAPDPQFAAQLRALVERSLTPIAPAFAPDPVVLATRSPSEATMSLPPAPLSPYLSVAGAAAAIDWYVVVLGAIETLRFAGDDGRVGHAELAIGSARLMLADEYPEIDFVGPVTRGGTTVTLHLEVADVDHTHRRAVAAGARSEREPADQGHGNRNATMVDPYGHRWMLSQTIDTERAAAAERERGVGGNGEAWTVTLRPPVEPGYLVLHTADLARSSAFYGSLFGWNVGGGNMEGGGHVENTMFPLGFAPEGDDAVTTSVYFRVDDLDRYVDATIALGGRVLSRSEFPSGPNAACEDDQGRRFDLWKPAPGY